MLYFNYTCYNIIYINILYAELILRYITVGEPNWIIPTPDLLLPPIINMEHHD